MIFVAAEYRRFAGLPAAPESICRSAPRLAAHDGLRLITSSQGFAAFSPAARVSASRLLTKSSSSRLVSPRAFDIRCYLVASTGFAEAPRPVARMRARRSWAMGLPRSAARRNRAAAATSYLATPSPL